MQKKILFILIGLAILSACQTGRRKEVSADGISVKVIRFDRLQYEAAVLNSFSAWQKMSTECPQATKLLVEDVLGIGSANMLNLNERLSAFYSDTLLLRLMEDATIKFMDVSEIEKGLTQGFKVLRKDIPDFVVPQVYAQISALNQSVVVGDSLLGFSIDKYMGADYPLYRNYYYAYQRKSMTPDRIVPDCFTFYLLSYYPFPWEEGNRTLFDIMVYQGKIAWVVSHILGYDSEGARIMGYSPEEIKWCKKNKGEVWNYMRRHEHLSATDPMIIRAYTRPDPGIVFKGEKVPSCIGIWMGYQLIDAYMEQHEDTSIRGLLERRNFHDLLHEIKIKF